MSPGRNAGKSVIFQMTFAILTAALMIDAFAGRMKFSAMLVFIVTWSICVYSPICHWVWAEGGYFFDMGVLDYRDIRLHGI